MRRNNVGYFDKAIKRVFKDASEVREDWPNKQVTFQLFSANSSIRFKYPSAELLKVFGDNVTLNFEARGDSRYQDQGDVGVVLEVTLHGVTFPEGPG